MDNLFTQKSLDGFDQLCSNVKACTLCPRMNDSQRILSRASGNLNAQIMFIAEAPGRLGADKFSIPLHGDKTGQNFETLLEFAGLERTDLFITNAVLCNPRDEKGNNSTPTKEEIKNCASFLRAQIEMVNPHIIVTLGATALLSLSFIEEHELSLKKNVRTTNLWFNRKLIPLYHPGQRAMLHRSMGNQRSDYQFIKETLNKLKQNNSQGLLKSYGGKIKESVLSVVTYILRKRSVNYFALHKLFYLIEYQYAIKFGKRLTSAYIIRQKDGPYCTDLNVNKLKLIKGIKLAYTSKINFTVILDNQDLFSSIETSDELDTDVMDLIDEIMLKYSGKSNASLKRSVYFTQPMRNMLYYENEHKINLYNTPIDFVNTTNAYL